MNAHTQTLCLLAASALFGVTALAGTTETFPIQIGSSVSPGFIDGVATAGAGNIENPGDQDHYTFQGTVGQVIYLDRWTGAYPMAWALVEPDGRVVTWTYLNTDLGRFQLTKEGTYSVRVYAHDGQSTGTYSFKLWGVSDDVFPLALGDVVIDGAINGVPAEGAGNLEQPGTYDIYTFQGTVGQVIYLDRWTGASSLAWALVEPGDRVVTWTYLNTDLGRFQLTKEGTYSVRVYAHDGQSTGTYSFKFWGVSDDVFPLVPGDVVIDGAINGVPAEGVGNLEQPGTHDVYTFQGTVGQNIYLDQWTGAYPVAWALVEPDGRVVTWTYLNTDLGRFQLTKEGMYSVLVYAHDGQSTGTYSFKLWGVSDDEFTLVVGDVVTNGFINGVPAEGAGNLEQPGTHDVYTFQGTVGQNIYLDQWTGAYPVAWALVEPDGRVVTWTYLNTDLGRFQLTKEGMYSVLVYAHDGQSAGTYSFQLNGLRSPVAGDDVAGTTVNRAVELPIVRLLANDTDPDHDTLTLVLPGSTTSQGGTVAISGSDVRYTPPTDFDGTDTFTYEVDDGWEHSDTATVTVRVRRPETLGLNTITALRNPDGSIALEMAGIPGQTYQLWYAPDVAAGPWAVLAAVVADANGVVRYTDNSAIGVPSRFYRLAEAP